MAELLIPNYLLIISYTFELIFGSCNTLGFVDDLDFVIFLWVIGNIYSGFVYFWILDPFMLSLFLKLPGPKVNLSITCCLYYLSYTFTALSLPSSYLLNFDLGSDERIFSNLSISPFIMIVLRFFYFCSFLLISNPLYLVPTITPMFSRLSCFSELFSIYIDY